ncbi:exocyst complex component Sec10-like protein [Spinellus fusiger]|nr:exocyst complex component Sec10-like protein [Spinellus fusiger]
MTLHNDAHSTPTPPTPVKVARLPPDILISIFKYLPIYTLATVAVVSRRFKVLAYDDEIWDDKLQRMLKSDTGEVASLLDQPTNELSLVGQDTHLLINNKPLNTLIPGLSKDPYNSRARAKSTGQAREKFKGVYVRVLPFYVDLRNTHAESKVLQDFGAAPEACGKTLNLMVGLGQCCVVDDWRELNEKTEALCQYFESASLHEFEVAHNANNFNNMKVYCHALIALNGGQLCIQTFLQKHPLFYDNPFKADENFVDLEPFKRMLHFMTIEMQKQAELIAKVFPISADVYYMFADRVFEDVIADYVGLLLGRAQTISTRLYLHTITTVLDAVNDLLQTLITDSGNTPMDSERGIHLLFKLFFPLLDDYMYEEKKHTEDVCVQCINEWNISWSTHREDPSTRLTNQSRETFKRNYILAFKKVIALPVDLVSSAATSIASPFQRSNSFLFRSEEKGSVKKVQSLISVDNSPTSPQSTPPSTPKTSVTIPRHKKTDSSSSNIIKSPTDSQSSKHSIKSITLPDTKQATVTDILEDAQQELDSLQNLISLEVALQLIHVNKDAVRRVHRFIHIGFPGRMELDIQKTFEHVFIRLLKALGPSHIQVAFERASERLLRYKPDAETLRSNSGEVPPLTEFFEMVHVADMVQQMVQVYYEEEITRYVDKHDFMNEVNKEKKIFERLLDDCVAQGMDHGIQVLLARVELILANKQRSEDYNPLGQLHMDLKPTKACLETIECLKSNISTLAGAAEKSTMDLFFSEIGRRFFEILCKHLKSQMVNEQGGFRYICDMNAYYAFAVGLKQKTVTPYFSALKSLSNIYIISSPTDIKNVIHDLERYHGLMRIEDLFEFAACRVDWPVIKKVVQKDMTDCSIM